MFSITFKNQNVIQQGFTRDLGFISVCILHYKNISYHEIFHTQKYLT